jgi:hypothetical protein
LSVACPKILTNAIAGPCVQPRWNAAIFEVLTYPACEPGDAPAGRGNNLACIPRAGTCSSFQTRATVAQDMNGFASLYTKKLPVGADDEGMLAREPGRRHEPLEDGLQGYAPGRQLLLQPLSAVAPQRVAGQAARNQHHVSRKPNAGSQGHRLSPPRQPSPSTRPHPHQGGRYARDRATVSPGPRSAASATARPLGGRRLHA